MFCGAYFSNVLLTKCAKSSSHCDVRKLTSLEQFARLRFVFKLIRFFRSDSDFDAIVFAVVRLKLMSNISQAIASVGIEPVARQCFQISTFLSKTSKISKYQHFCPRQQIGNQCPLQTHRFTQLLTVLVFPTISRQRLNSVLPIFQTP